MSGGPYPLPNAHAAFVADGKIRDYLLNPQHPGNGGKAGFFTSYGFSLRDWHKLAEALQKHAAAHAVTRTRPSAYGTRFEIRGRLRLKAPIAAILTCGRSGSWTHRTATLAW